ncbi:SCO5717 family growth-regulating ATPase [Streptomyces sp. NPDC093510]|uniref:SCO5717 family growth-regulating ATPase n=1 Tax=Streptomyces sp. NPDC093510 TaxID=3155199 RepID=UPI0034405D18
MHCDVGRVGRRGKRLFYHLAAGGMRFGEKRLERAARRRAHPHHPRRGSFVADVGETTGEFKIDYTPPAWYLANDSEAKPEGEADRGTRAWSPGTAGLVGQRAAHRVEAEQIS